MELFSVFTGRPFREATRSADGASLGDSLRLIQPTVFRSGETSKAN
jgi:hypothetical protein